MVYLIQIVTQEVKAQIDKLVEKKIGLNIKIKQDDFKIEVQQFAKRMKDIVREINNAINSRQ